MPPSTVVLIDDDTDSRINIADYLRDVAGFAVEDFPNGEDALCYLQANEERCRAVLLDLILEPGRISGKAMLEALTSTYPQLPVVVFTGLDPQGGIQTLGQGAYANLQKPLDLKELETIIRDIADREAIFMQMANDVRKLLDSDLCIAWRLERREHRFRVAGWSGPLDNIYRQTTMLDATDQMWQRFLKLGEPLFLPDITDPAIEERYRHRRAAMERGWRSLLTVPLVHDGRVIGLIDSYTKTRLTFKDPNTYNTTINTLRAFAHQATAAVRHTVLSQQAHLLQEINQVLADTMEEEAVLQPILVKATEAVGADWGYLHLVDAENAALTCRKTIKLSPDELDVTYAIGESISQTAAAKGVVQVDGSASQEDYSVAAIPLRRGERTTGVLTVTSRFPSYFGADDVSLLQALSALAAVAIERAKLAQHLQKVSRLALTAIRFEDLADYVAKAVRDLTGAAITLWMMSDKSDERDEWLRIYASAGKISPDFVADAKLTMVLDSSINARALHTGKPIIKADISGDETYFYQDVAHEHGWHSYMAVPMHGREQEPLGVLSLHDQATKKFGEPDAQLVQTFANQAAVAFQQQRRILAMQQLAEVGQTLAVSMTEARQLLLQVATIAKDLTGADCTAIYPYATARKLFYHTEAITVVGLWDERKRITEKARTSGLAAAVRQHEAVIVNDIDQDQLRVGRNWRVSTDDDECHRILSIVRSAKFIQREKVKAFVGMSLLAHIRDEGEASEEVGVLYVNFRSPHQFTTEELQIIQIYAQHVANVIRGARLYEQTRALANRNARLLEQERILRELSSAINANLGLNDVIDQILGGLDRVITFEKATIQLFQGNERTLLAFRGWGEKAEIDPWLLRPMAEDRLVSRIIRRREPAILSHARKSSYWDICDGTTDVGSWVGLPLIYMGEVFGLVTLDHRRPGFYKQQDKDMLVLFANQAAIAIRNAQLYSQMEKLVDERTRAWQQERERATAAEKLAVSASLGAQFVHRVNNLGGTIPVRVNLAKENLDLHDPGQAAVVRELEQISVELRDLLQAAEGIKHATDTRASEVVDINELLETAIEQGRRATPDFDTTINIVRDLMVGLPEVSIDRTGLLDVFSNVIRNAVDAMPKGGTLAVTSVLYKTKQAPCIVVAVADTGIGIAAKDLSRVFDLFFTRKKNGWGFGLWHDKTFLNQFGGDIDVTSKEDEGSTFSIQIPVVPSQGDARRI